MTETAASYAVTEGRSRGRKFPEKTHFYRSDFERDRDRIIHSEAFRLLEGKTQVFMPGVDDHYRNRLTHTIEVAQIGRTIAKALQVNETLTEAICLAHDLGHSPFGHTGEKVLNELMERFGGFEHNAQTVRIVELLEHPYSDFTGLNLMYETRLGLSKHHSRYDIPAEGDFTERNCSLEGQIADIADRIAYNCHDLEDGMRSKIISEERLGGLEIWKQAGERINAGGIEDAFIRRTRTAKGIIDMLVSDIIETSAKAIGEANVKTVEEVYNHNGNLIVLSGDAEKKLAKLEDFLMENLYTNELLLKTTKDVKKRLGELFGKLCKRPEKMSQYYQRFIAGQGLERTVCDYIAGMTDRFCMKLLEKI